MLQALCHRVISQATNVNFVVTEQSENGLPRLNKKGAAKAKSRRERLAAALRRNLQRRKIQQGSRKIAPGQGNLVVKGTDNSE